MRKLLVAVIAMAALLVSAGTAYAAIRVTTYVAKPVHIHLNSAPRCTTLRYLLSTRAEEVDLDIINSSGREVWEAEKTTKGLSGGVLHSFTWCAQKEGGGKVAPGVYRWRVSAEQAGTDADGASAWRTVYVVR